MQKALPRILLEIGWLSRQPAPFRDEVLARGEVRTYAKGQRIYALGDDPGGIFGIVEGDVAVRIAPRHSDAYIAHFAGPGTWFGEGSFLTGGPRRVGLEAGLASTMFHLPLPAMESLAAADPMAARRFGEIAMLNIDGALAMIDDLLIPETDQRIAATLVRSLGFRPSGLVRLSQAELGRLSNAPRQAVNRAIGRFRARGWVSLRYGSVEVVDGEGLRAFAAGDG